MALMDQILDTLARTEGEMVFFPKSEHAGDGLPPPFALFLGKRGCPAGRRFQSVFDDFLRRTTDTASERRFEQLLPVRCEVDRHRDQYTVGWVAAGIAAGGE
jgi:hypothetical protein